LAEATQAAAASHAYHCAVVTQAAAAWFACYRAVAIQAFAAHVACFQALETLDGLPAVSARNSVAAQFWHSEAVASNPGRGYSAVEPAAMTSSASQV